MSDTARDYQTIDPASTEGLESFFEQAPVTCALEPVPFGEAPVTCAAEPIPGVPIELAAKALGTSINALKKRLRKGTLRGVKQEIKHGEKWFVDSSEIDGCLAPVTTKAESIVTDLAPVTCAIEPIPCASKPDSPTSAFDLGLIVRIRELEERLEGASYRNGYLEAENQGLKALLANQETQIKLLTDSQHKGGWWARFSSWFFGRG